METITERDEGRTRVGAWTEGGSPYCSCAHPLSMGAKVGSNHGDSAIELGRARWSLSLAFLLSLV